MALSFAFESSLMSDEQIGVAACMPDRVIYGAIRSLSRLTSH
jgi:hypothetical protein